MAPFRVAAAAKSLQSCPTLCDPIDGSPPGSPVPEILQARTLEWVAISFFNAWTWKVKVKSLSHVWLLATPWTVAYRLLRPWDFPGKSTGVGCHCLLPHTHTLGPCYKLVNLERSPRISCFSLEAFKLFSWMANLTSSFLFIMYRQHFPFLPSFLPSFLLFILWVDR